MDSNNNEERRKTRDLLKEEFNFYFQFIRSLVIDLPEADDKTIAAAWVQKLKPESLESAETDEIRLRLDYLKLLLFVLQRRHLVGIFKRQPPTGSLEPFPQNFSITDMGNMLLEQDERQSLGGGDARSTPYAIEISNDLKEFVAAQEIPNFGVQVFYAMSIDDPVHRWAFFDERRFPKFIREKIEQLKLMKSAGNINLLKSKQSLLTDQSQSLKDIDEITNLNKCTSKVRSPLEIERSQERIYQAYINYDGSRPSSDFNDKCNGSEKSWRKVRTTKKVCPDGMEVSVTKIDESGPPIESDPDCRSNVRVTRSSTLREVEVKGDDEKAVEAAAKKELENLMKEHSKLKGSGSCECHNHKRPGSSRRCSPDRNQQRIESSLLGRRDCPDMNNPRPASSVVRPRTPCRAPCTQPSRNFDEDISVQIQNGSRGRSPCGHAKKHTPGCGGSRCPCCPCPKPTHPPCSCKSASGGARETVPQVSPGGPCRSRTTNGNGHYQSNGNGNGYRGGSNQPYERGGDISSDIINATEEREQERRARLRRIAELQDKRTIRCGGEPRPEANKTRRSSDSCPCPCNKEPAEDESSPCIGAVGGPRTPKKPPCPDEPSRRPKSPCAPSRGLKTPSYKETAIKSLCNETTKYKGPERGRTTPTVKTRIVEKSEKIIEPYQDDDQKEATRTLPAFTNRHQITPPAGLRTGRTPPRDPEPEDSIILPTSPGYNESYNRYGQRYTSTPKHRCGGETPEFGDISRIERPHERERTMLSPIEPTNPFIDENCVSSNESDFDLESFPDDFSANSPDCTPKSKSPISPCGANGGAAGGGGLPEKYFHPRDDSPPSTGKIIEQEGILDYLSAGLTDSIYVNQGDYVSGAVTDDDTFSSPENVNYETSAHERSRGTPPCWATPTHRPTPPCPGRRTTPPSRPPCPPPRRQVCPETPRPRYETPLDRPRRPPQNFPRPLPRNLQTYTPTMQRMPNFADDSQTSDSDAYDYSRNPRRNLLSDLESQDRSQRTERSQPVQSWKELTPRRADSGRDYERRQRDEQRSCGCDDETSDEHYNRRPRRYD